MEPLAFIVAIEVIDRLLHTGLAPPRSCKGLFGPAHAEGDRLARLRRIPSPPGLSGLVLRRGTDGVVSVEPLTRKVLDQLPVPRVGFAQLALRGPRVLLARTDLGASFIRDRFIRPLSSASPSLGWRAAHRGIGGLLVRTACWRMRVAIALSPLRSRWRRAEVGGAARDNVAAGGPLRRAAPARHQLEPVLIDLRRRRHPASAATARRSTASPRRVPRFGRLPSGWASGRDARPRQDRTLPIGADGTSSSATRASPRRTKARWRWPKA
jgi:hypothetical protein